MGRATRSRARTGAPSPVRAATSIGDGVGSAPGQGPAGGVCAGSCGNQPVGQQTLVPMGIGWVSYKAPPPVSPGKTRAAEFVVEAHPVPERFVLPEDIEDWTETKQH